MTRTVKTRGKVCKEILRLLKVLDRLVWLNACFSSLSVPTRISSVATLSAFVSLPMSILLGAISLAAASVSGVAAVLTSKYQKKLTKVMKLVDIVTEIDEREFQVLQDLHLKVINELANVDHKMEL